MNKLIRFALIGATPTFIVFGNASVALGQESVATANLTACSEAVAADDEDAAKRTAELAERAYEAWLDDEPRNVEALTGLARVLGQCRIAYANIFAKGIHSNRSIGLLQDALEIDPNHWGARYTLALNYYFTPEMFGKTSEAIREFERVLRQQGDSTEFPEMAGPYAYLGDLYVRAGRQEDAVELWERGANLFPNDARLTARLAEDRNSGK